VDISEHLCGRFLTERGLPKPWQVWTIDEVGLGDVGEEGEKETKVLITFQETTKPLGMNKTNLRRVAKLYGNEADAWKGKKLLVYRTMTQFGEDERLCVRVCGPEEIPDEMPRDAHGGKVKFE